MSSERTEYIGTLRPRITLLEEIVENGRRFNKFRVEWIEGEDVSNVIWKEEIKVPEDQSFVPQITGYGTYTKRGGFFVDEDNKRHFVIDAKEGIFGARGNDSNLTHT